ncbi:MAG: PorV/PorQ family protein [Candidatus Marinimicrobia bacterium]|nr:PorV/PorQ family protein [Candidatus Neomarinimicrobiota bacterium]
MIKKIIWPIIFTLIPGFLAADTFAPVGTAVAQFLEIGVGARATGMGEAFTVMAEDAEASFWNPAGLANIEDYNLFTGYTQWPAGISIGGLSFAKSFKGIGTFAINTVYLMTDDMDVTTVEMPEGTGETFSISNYSVGLSYARYITDRVSVGITNKIVHEDYFDYGYTSWALDLGTTYRTDFRGLKLGMSILHFSPEIKFDGNYIDYSDPKSYETSEEREFDKYSLPINFRVGAAMNALEMDNHRLVIAADMVHPNNNKEQYNAGLEYSMKSMIFLRAGYKLSADEGGFSIGGGAKINLMNSLNFMVNYSYSDMGVLNGINRFSVNLLF